MKPRAGRRCPAPTGRFVIVVLLGAAAAAAVCSGCRRQAPPSPPSPPATQEAEAVAAGGGGETEERAAAAAAPHFEVKAIAVKNGVATWYDVPERSLPARRAWRTEFTAAHKRWPIGAYVRVSSLENGKSVIVRVTDRGPNARGAVIDLSRPAAEELDMVRVGRMRVRLEQLKVSASTDKPVTKRRAGSLQPTEKLDGAATREDEKGAAAKR